MSVRRAGSGVLVGRRGAPAQPRPGRRRGPVRLARLSSGGSGPGGGAAWRTASRSACSGSTPGRAGPRHQRQQLGTDRRGRPGAGSEPALASRPSTLSASASAGSASGIPSSTCERCFSAALSRSQLRSTSAASATSSPAKTWGCRWTSLSHDAAGDVVDVEAVRVRARRRPGRGRRPAAAGRPAPRAGAVVAGRVPGVDRLEGLVGLLEQVRRQRPVGLLAVPGALGAQPVHHLDELEQPRPRRVRSAVRGGPAVRRPGVTAVSCTSATPAAARRGSPTARPSCPRPRGRRPAPTAAPSSARPRRRSTLPKRGSSSMSASAGVLLAQPLALGEGDVLGDLGRVLPLLLQRLAAELDQRRSGRAGTRSTKASNVAHLVLGHASRAAWAFWATACSTAAGSTASSSTRSKASSLPMSSVERLLAGRLRGRLLAAGDAAEAAEQQGEVVDLRVADLGALDVRGDAGAGPRAGGQRGQRASAARPREPATRGVAPGGSAGHEHGAPRSAQRRGRRSASAGRSVRPGRAHGRPVEHGVDRPRAPRPAAPRPRIG